MNTSTDLDDYWTQQYSPPETPSEPHLNIETIEGVEPLDAQFGVVEPKTVPDALYGPLFGQPEPREAELEQAGGDPAAVPPMHTYAILDAAKVGGLPELLAASGLEHSCLFKGEAFEELAEVAPWIVQLEDGNSFTRNLFTRSDAPWHLCDKEPGIYLRSRGTLDETWRHFRKFTKVKSSDETRAIFRFWDAVTARVYFSGIRANQARIEQFFRLPSGTSIELIVVDPFHNTLHLTPPHSDASNRQRRPLIFEEHDHHLMKNVSYYALSNEIAHWLNAAYPSEFERFSRVDMDAIAKHVVSVGRTFNLPMKEDFSYLAQMMMAMGGWFLQDANHVALLHILRDSEPKKAKRLEDTCLGHHETTPQAELMRQWPQVREYLAALPAAERITAERFGTFRTEFLKDQAPDLSGTFSATITRLRDIGLSGEQQEGRAIVLSLMLGPRFFEDPFKPWSHLPPEQAVDTAWNSTIGLS
ncbi:MAG: DUF4123 domain-containing protein [Litoreibacter sp.]|uniref:DUF4123 domain-containing protein n=1 Tax=Litoreibacter sp. TaxID=1969459 RepID=UPI003296DEB6